MRPAFHTSWKSLRDSHIPTAFGYGHHLSEGRENSPNLLPTTLAIALYRVTMGRTMCEGNFGVQ